MATTPNRRIWIVSGPSSVGKTTFIESPRLREITGLGGDFLVHLASSGFFAAGSRDLVVHYNIQRPLHQFLLAEQPHTGVDPSAAAVRFAADPVWSRLLVESDVHAIVLAVEVERLRHRVTRRAAIESADDRYPVAAWTDRYAAVDVRDIYRAWLRELERHGIPTTLLDARDRTFRQLGSPAELMALLEGRNPVWSRTRIEQWNDAHRFQYQQVHLPLGLSTPGTERSATRDLVFKESVAGKSVLDVGSAEGYFCFEAELRDAAQIKGIEPKKVRYDLACDLKEIRGSRVEFECRDVMTDPIDEDWDVILLLNVIHHLSEPIRVLRNLAQHARESLIIEFPTFADPRFKAHRRIRVPWFYNRRPLIGVSSLVKGVAQTFVFSPHAIEAILLELDTPIRKVRFDSSPVAGRLIAHATR